MAGIFAGLLSLLGLGGCKRDHIILDGPGMVYEPKHEFVGTWYCEENGLSLVISADKFIIAKDNNAVSENEWEFTFTNEDDRTAVGKGGAKIGEYVKIVQKDQQYSTEFGDKEYVLVGYKTADASECDTFVYSNPSQRLYSEDELK
nr:hypothetical protein [Clostridia bacterium]